MELWLFTSSLFAVMQARKYVLLRLWIPENLSWLVKLAVSDSEDGERWTGTASPVRTSRRVISKQQRQQECPCSRLFRSGPSWSCFYLKYLVSGSFCSGPLWSWFSLKLIFKYQFQATIRLSPVRSQSSRNFVFLTYFLVLGLICLYWSWNISQNSFIHYLHTLDQPLLRPDLFSLQTHYK